MIPIFKPVVSESVIRAVTQTLRAGWLSEGKQVNAFEEEFRRRFALPHALALNSGTAALHLAVLGAGIGPGHQVIVPAQTFVATPMAVLYAGGTPVFADIAPGGPNLEPTDVAARISTETKAIIVVHYGGYPCDMDEINRLAEHHGLVVIEDAAHALGARHKGRPVGTLGNFAVFSFQAIKQITTGDGGMLVCKDPQNHQAAYRRRWFGIDRANRKPSDIGQPVWDISEVGFKYHMNDIAATMGLAQLQLFDAAQARRRAFNAHYRQELASVPGLRLLEEKSDRESACWLFTVLVERRHDFIRAVRSRGVQAAAWHLRVDQNSLFGGARVDLPNQAWFDSHQVSLPIRESLTDDEVDYVASAVKAGW